MDEVGTEMWDSAPCWALAKETGRGSVSRKAKLAELHQEAYEGMEEEGAEGAHEGSSDGSSWERLAVEDILCLPGGRALGYGSMDGGTMRADA